MANERLNPDMTDQEIILAMAGSNPGAIIACAQLLKYVKDAADPEHGFGDVLDTLVGLDRLGIWEERLAILWQICGYNVVKIIAVVKAYQHRLAGMNERILIGAINRVIVNVDPGIDLDAVMSVVREEFPRFNPVVT